MGHEARLVQGRLPVGEHDVVVAQVPVHNLAPHALTSTLGRSYCPLLGEQLLGHCLPLLLETETSMMSFQCITKI